MSKPDSEIKSGPRQIAVRIPADLNRQLQLIARRESNGIAAVCRRLIWRGLREEPGAHPDEAP